MSWDGGKEKQGSQSLAEVTKPKLGPGILADLNDLFFKHSSPHLCWGGLLVWSKGNFSFLNYHIDLTGIMIIMAEIIDVL